MVVYKDSDTYIIHSIEDGETTITEIRRFDTNTKIIMVPDTKGRLVIYNVAASGWQRFFISKLPKYYVLEIPQISIKEVKNASFR